MCLNGGCGWECWVGEEQKGGNFEYRGGLFRVYVLGVKGLLFLWEFFLQEMYCYKDFMNQWWIIIRGVFLFNF